MLHRFRQHSGRGSLRPHGASAWLPQLARRPAAASCRPPSLRCGSFHPFDTLRQAGAAAVRVTGGKAEIERTRHPFLGNYCALRGVPDLAQFAHGLGLFAGTRLVSRLRSVNNWAWCLWRSCLVRRAQVTRATGVSSLFFIRGKRARGRRRTMWWATREVN